MIRVFPSPQPRYTSCGDCGAWMRSGEVDDHVCEPGLLLDFQLVRLRPGVCRFETDLADWLLTPAGRFAIFYAARRR